MRCRVDIRHPLLCIWCLWHNSARTVQIVKQTSSRGVLGRIGVFFVRVRAFKKTVRIASAFLQKTPRIELVLYPGAKSMVSLGVSLPKIARPTGRQKKKRA